MGQTNDRTKKQQPRRRDTYKQREVAVADWQQANPTLVVQAIAICAYQGMALRFGYTRDGGAYAIGIYGDGDPFTEYVKPNEDIDAYLISLIENYRDGAPG